MLVGSGVGACEIVGDIEAVGSRVGPAVGGPDTKRVGDTEGAWDGLICVVGEDEMLGSDVGCDDTVGSMDGISEGASLCAIALKTTKSARETFSVAMCNKM